MIGIATVFQGASLKDNFFYSVCENDMSEMSGKNGSFSFAFSWHKRRTFANDIVH